MHLSTANVIRVVGKRVKRWSRFRLRFLRNTNTRNYGCMQLFLLKLTDVSHLNMKLYLSTEWSEIPSEKNWCKKNALQNIFATHLLPCLVSMVSNSLEMNYRATSKMMQNKKRCTKTCKMSTNKLHAIAERHVYGNGTILLDRSIEQTASICSYICHEYVSFVHLKWTESGWSMYGKRQI